MSTPAVRMNSTAARCGAEPLPEVPKFSFPGDFFAAAINSRSVARPAPACAATTSGEAVTLLTGTRSRRGSKPGRGVMIGFTRMLDGLAISTV